MLKVSLPFQTYFLSEAANAGGKDGQISHSELLGEDRLGNKREKFIWNFEHNHSVELDKEKLGY